MMTKSRPVGIEWLFYLIYFFTADKAFAKAQNIHNQILISGPILLTSPLHYGVIQLDLSYQN